MAFPVFDQVSLLDWWRWSGLAGEKKMVVVVVVVVVPDFRSDRTLTTGRRRLSMSQVSEDDRRMMAW